MVKTIFSSNGVTRGFAVLPKHGGRTATVREAVHDGDTINVEAAGAFSIRFLGVDTPEISFQFPKIPGDARGGTFRSILQFKDYLADPLSANYPDSQDYSNELGSGLLNYLRQKLNAQTAMNHYHHAMAAQRTLEDIVDYDLKEKVADDDEDFRFFMAFAYEIMDRYGRFLCYVDRDEKRKEKREGQLTYNERMLELGMAAPYFIWPNINPFRRYSSLKDAVPQPEMFKEIVDIDKRLTAARKFVSDARRSGYGIFDSNNPLLLLPFELRYIARRRKPDRYVVDLSKRNPKILKPTDYYLIQNIEDRLFIDEQFLPLFEKKGYDIDW